MFIYTCSVTFGQLTMLKFTRPLSPLPIALKLIFDRFKQKLSLSDFIPLHLAASF